MLFVFRREDVVVEIVSVEVEISYVRRRCYKKWSEEEHKSSTYWSNCTEG